jgi:hypothetical protein
MLSADAKATACALQVVFSRTGTDCGCMKVLIMIPGIAVRLLLLPMLVLVLPLMFAWAWIKEVTSERAPKSRSPMIGW